VKALVLLSRVLDVSLPLDLTGSDGPRLKGSPPIRILNRADRAALEWACRLCGSAVLALTVGPPEVDGILHLARARGAGAVIRCWGADMDRLDTSALSLLLASAVERARPDLVLGGERSVEGWTGLVPSLVAARLGWSCLEGASDVSLERDRVVVRRRLERGWQEEVEAELPAVVTVKAGTVEPRYVSARGRSEAGGVPVEVWTPEQLGMSADEIRASIRSEVISLDWPRPRPRKVELPNSRLSAADRMRQLMNRRVESSKPSPRDNKLIEGDAAEAARQIILFLAERGFIKPST
jgi:electron transfer flavoprotein beta subunit